MRIPALITAALLTVVASAAEAQSAKTPSFIRDAEVENIIRTFATPVFQAAGVDPSSVKLYLVNDNALNAFVTGGLKMFMNTGLLTRAETPGQVIGVIAHETGHISGGHLARMPEAIENATAQMILAYILGGAAAIGGRADVGSAIALGGQQMGMRSFLAFSQTQESAADHAAVKFLDGTRQSAAGLLQFMEVLSGQELLSAERQDPYLRTHPLTRDRIAFLREHVARSPYSEAPPPSEYVDMHRRMQAKLHAFLMPVPRTLGRYREGDESIEARYARAIAYYRKPDLEKALPLIDGLLAERPNDPYFHELKGQILFENGRPAEALPSYERAVQLLPSSALIRVDLARVQLELNDPDLLRPAIGHLHAALQQENDAPFTWRQLAIAYGRQGLMGESALALAEEAYLRGSVRDALYQAGKAAQLLPRGTPGWLRAEDIQQAAKEAQGKARRK